MLLLNLNKGEQYTLPFFMFNYINKSRLNNNKLWLAIAMKNQNATI